MGEDGGDSTDVLRRGRKSEEVWEEGMFGEASRADQPAQSGTAEHVESQALMKGTDEIEETNETTDPYSPAARGASKSVTPVATVKKVEAAIETPRFGGVRRKVETRPVGIPDVDSRNLKKMKTENKEAEIFGGGFEPINEEMSMF